MTQHEFRRRAMAAGGGIPLSDLPAGTLVGLEESGAVVPFLVAGHDYESSGRTMLLRKWLMSEKRQWHSANINAYASSAIDTWLNGSYLALFSAELQSQISEVPIVYTVGNGNTAVTTISRKAFLLSGTEMQYASQYFHVEGSGLSLFADAASKMGYLENAPATVCEWWLRTVYFGSKATSGYVSRTGAISFEVASTLYGVRPAFTLPADFRVKPAPDANGCYRPA